MAIDLHISTDGSRSWYINDQPHNKYNSAFEWADGTKVWYKYDKYHRLDGPAIEHADGYKEYWINHFEYKTYLEYVVAVEQHNLNKDTYDN